MAIIAFWSDERKETGQTLSMVALSTYMAIEHNYRILSVSTNFKDSTLEDCYWTAKDVKASEQVVASIQGAPSPATAGFDSGVEGLVKVIKSNRTTPNIVANYTKVVFNERLDVLCSPQTTKYEEYKEIARMYPEILTTANRYYNLIFVDISKRMDNEDVKRILEVADVIVVNITQRRSIINKFYELRQGNQFFKNNNILLNVGRYDGYSQFNIKNISRYIGMKRDIMAVPYNTLFFESCSDGKAANFFLGFRGSTVADRNVRFINEVSKMSEEVLYKLKELNIKM